MPDGLKETLQAKVETVKAKVERWRDHIRRTPGGLASFGPGADFMDEQIRFAEEAILNDDVMAMISAVQELAIHDETAA